MSSFYDDSFYAKPGVAKAPTAPSNGPAPSSTPAHNPAPYQQAPFQPAPPNPEPYGYNPGYNPGYPPQPGYNPGYPPAGPPAAAPGWAPPPSSGPVVISSPTATPAPAPDLPDSVYHPNKVVQIVFMVLGGLMIIAGAGMLGYALSGSCLCSIYYYNGYAYRNCSVCVSTPNCRSSFSRTVGVDGRLFLQGSLFLAGVVILPLGAIFLLSAGIAFCVGQNKASELKRLNAASAASGGDSSGGMGVVMVHSSGATAMPAAAPAPAPGPAYGYGYPAPGPAPAAYGGDYNYNK